MRNGTLGNGNNGQWGWGAVGVWIAMVIDWVCRVICFVARMKSGAWKTKYQA